MDNYQIADSFSLLAKLMDIHGENSFKSKSYSIAAFTIEKLPVQLNSLPPQNIFTIKGIGESTGKKVIEILESGSLKSLSDLIQKTPPGVLEMLNIKGIGPKKISTIWKEMEIESIGELLYACEENRLKLFEGFGEKTQQNVIDTIEFYLKSKGSYLFSQVEPIAEETKKYFNELFPVSKTALTGAYKRQLEIINELEIVVDEPMTTIENKLEEVANFELIEKNKTDLLYQVGPALKLRLYASDEKPFMENVFIHSSSEEFIEAFRKTFPAIDYTKTKSEEDIFSQVHIAYIPSCRREDPATIQMASGSTLPGLIEANHIKGIIHSHSNWSDGDQTIEEMAKAAMESGFEYLVISDHSKSAFYANGLSEDRIKQQHQYVDTLNADLAPFRIFKSIESDILNDGSLDYSNNILSTFDLVIASVHSNLKMNEEKAMARLLRAIENPYTTILGHVSGRLLLSRKGYPLEYKKIIDACAANQVVIELNANPRRLDIDWRHINYALEKKVLISIDPDAHSINGFKDIRYGAIAAQKSLLSKEQNLSSFSLSQFQAFIDTRKELKNI